MKKYLATVLTLGVVAFSIGIPLTPVKANELSGMGLHASSSELPACPSLFRCDVK